MGLLNGKSRLGYGPGSGEIRKYDGESRHSLVASRVAPSKRSE